HRCTAFRPVLLSEGSLARPPHTGRQKVFASPSPHGVRRPSDDYDAGDPRIPKFSDRLRQGRGPDEMRALYTARVENQRLGALPAPVASRAMASQSKAPQYLTRRSFMKAASKAAIRSPSSTPRSICLRAMARPIGAS